MTSSTDDARVKTPGIIKIIGIGQSMRGDDAAGLAAVRLWQALYPDNAKQPFVQVELAELPGVGLLDLLEGASVAILVDGVRSGAEPGTIHQLSVDELETFTTGSGSAHGWGVGETLALGQVLMPASMPQKIFLVGIEAGDISLGQSLSPAVEQALPAAAQRISQLIMENQVS